MSISSTGSAPRSILLFCIRYWPSGVFLNRLLDIVHEQIKTFFKIHINKIIEINNANNGFCGHPCLDINIQFLHTKCSLNYTLHKGNANNHVFNLYKKNILSPLDVDWMMDSLPRTFYTFRCSDWYFPIASYDITQNHY